MQPETTVHEQVGGDGFFVDLVDRFYAGVEHDDVLRPMYPEDLSAPRRHLAAFLAQYWGGPPRYSKERGHPRLRMRHNPFRVDDVARDAWLHHMLAAVKASDLSPELEAAFTDYFVRAADFMRNTEG